MALILLMNVSTVFAGAGSSGGGDPLEINATAFEDMKLLTGATDLAKSKIAKSFLSEIARSQYMQESDELIANNKFKVLPSIILVGDEEQEGYTLPAEANRFIALGGMTKFQAGANVYLAERVQKYSQERLSKLVMHEILHHILPAGLTGDEKFVDELTSAIVKESADPKLVKAIALGFSPSAVYINRDAFLKAAKIDELLEYCQSRFDRDKSDFLTPFRKSLPENLASLTIYEFEHKLSEIGNQMHVNSRQTIEAYKGLLLRNLAVRINPESRAVKSPDFGCATKLSLMSFCKIENFVKMSEAYSL